MRFLLAFLVVMVGCVATLPSDHSITADLAAETARMVVQMRQEIPPTPAPPSDGKCTNCVDGFIGDGRVKIVCPVCKGTGKK
jgi:hypothetical protein